MAGASADSQIPGPPTLGGALAASAAAAADQFLRSYQAHASQNQSYERSALLDEREGTELAVAPPRGASVAKPTQVDMSMVTSRDLPDLGGLVTPECLKVSCGACGAMSMMGALMLTMGARAREQMPVSEPAAAPVFVNPQGFAQKDVDEDDDAVSDSDGSSSNSDASDASGQIQDEPLPEASGVVKEHLPIIDIESGDLDSARGDGGKMQQYAVAEMLRVTYIGTEYCAVSKSEGNCVLKFIDAAALKKRTGEDVPREIELLQTCNHDNIVKMFDHFTTDLALGSQEPTKMFVLAIDRHQGCSLITALNKAWAAPVGVVAGLKSGVSEVVATKVIHDVAAALCYLHENDIIHGSVAPPNIFLGTPYLQDEDTMLGEARIRLGNFSNVTNASKKPVMRDLMVGNPLLLAPELKGPNDQLTSKIDMFPLGLIMFQMYYKHYPLRTAFDGMKTSDLDDKTVSAGMKEMRERIRAEGFDVAKSSAKFKNVVKGLLRINADKRSSASDVLDALGV